MTPTSWTADEDEDETGWQVEEGADTPAFEELMASGSRDPTVLALKEVSKATHSHQPGSIPQRTNKNAPTAMSSRRPVPRNRPLEGNSERKFRDPRFDNASQGELSEQQFQKNYSFLSSMRKRELKELRMAASRARKRIKSTPSTIRHEADAELDKLELSRKHLESQIARDRQIDMNRRVQQDHNSNPSGGGRSYMKKGDSKARLLEAKYEDLRQHKGRKAVEKLINSRRRKLAGRPTS